MSRRIDAYLDGELARDDLTADELAQAAAFEAQVGELRAALGASSPADMDGRVMRRIAELGLEPLPAPRPARARRWLRALWTQHSLTLQWRPAYALAAALTIALGTAVLAPVLRQPAPDDAIVLTGRRPIYVQFRLHTTAAQNVTLAGSFSGWKPMYPLQQVGDGVWTVLLPIEPGVHDYAFVIDGEQWVPDPYAPQVEDGFGGRNSRLTLLAPTDL